MSATYEVVALFIWTCGWRDYARVRLPLWPLWVRAVVGPMPPPWVEPAADSERMVRVEFELHRHPDGSFDYHERPGQTHAEPWTEAVVDSVPNPFEGRPS